MGIRLTRLLTREELANADTIELRAERDLEGESYEFGDDKEDIKIGRHYSMDVQLDAEDLPIEGGDGLSLSYVSREHCQIFRASDGYVVEDLDSHNGTFLNGYRIKRKDLYDGAVLWIGSDDRRLRVRID